MWYVVQTVAGKEEACLRLCQQYADESTYKEMFIPAYIAKMHFRKEWHDVMKTLFPGYIFIDTENIDGIFCALNSVGRRTKFLKDAEMVAPVTKEEQKYLKSMMNENHIVLSSVGLIIGDKICITEGPLKNHYGNIKKIDRHRRIAKLEINFFGRPTPAEVGLEIIAKLSQKEFDELKKKKSLMAYEENTWMAVPDNYNIDNIKIQEKRERYMENSFGCKSGADEIQVEIISGIFEGLVGKFISRSSDGKEYAVLIELFDVPAKVVFSKEEIIIKRNRSA